METYCNRVRQAGESRHSLLDQQTGGSVAASVLVQYHQLVNPTRENGVLNSGSQRASSKTIKKGGVSTEKNRRRKNRFSLKTSLQYKITKYTVRSNDKEEILRNQQ